MTTREHRRPVAGREAAVRQDRWLIVGVIGAILACVACFTPVAVIGLGALGLGAFTGHLDAALVALLVGCLALVGYRVWARVGHRG